MIPKMKHNLNIISLRNCYEKYFEMDTKGVFYDYHQNQKDKLVTYTYCNLQHCRNNYMYQIFVMRCMYETSKHTTQCNRNEETTSNKRQRTNNNSSDSGLVVEIETLNKRDINEYIHRQMCKMDTCKDRSIIDRSIRQYFDIHNNTSEIFYSIKNTLISQIGIHYAVQYLMNNLNGAETEDSITTYNSPEQFLFSPHTGQMLTLHMQQYNNNMKDVCNRNQTLCEVKDINDHKPVSMRLTQSIQDMMKLSLTSSGGVFGTTLGSCLLAMKEHVNILEVCYVEKYFDMCRIFVFY